MFYLKLFIYVDSLREVPITTFGVAEVGFVEPLPNLIWSESMRMLIAIILKSPPEEEDEEQDIPTKARGTPPSFSPSLL